MFLIPKMTEKNIAKTASWMDAASRIIVLTIPIIAYIWSSEFDRRFESLKDDLSGQFITKDEADQSFVARNRFIDSTSSTNEIISMHAADADHHLSSARMWLQKTCINQTGFPTGSNSQELRKGYKLMAKSLTSYWKWCTRGNTPIDNNGFS